MSRPLTTLLLVGTFLVPACAIYDAELLEQAVGEGDGDGDGSGNSPGSGGGDGDGDGDGDSGGNGTTTGGVSGDGDGDNVGGTGMGGTGGTGAGGLSGDGGGGNGDGGTGGMGTGGTDPGVCSGSGKKTAYAFATNLIVDEFNDLSRQVGGSSFDGNWIVVNDSTGTNLLPQVDGALLDKDYDPCFEDEEDLALHITGTGFAGWGASYDANLQLSGDPVDLSDYTHIIVWSRLGATRDQQQYYLSFSWNDGDSTVTTNTSVDTLTSKKWGSAQEFPIPAAVDKTMVEAISIVIAGSNGSGDPVDFDIWFDDLMLVTK